MAFYFGMIDTYFLNVPSAQTHDHRRLMNLNGVFGKAVLWFLPEGDPLPDNRKRPDQDIFFVYYHMDAWAAILDVLRNEKPVYFHYNDTNNVAQIYTGPEPVGEEE